MEIINKTEIKKFVKATLIIVCFFVAVPLALYVYYFSENHISTATDAWANFGSYFGGIIGTLFNLVAAFFSLISIYITLRIATYVQQAENNFNTDNSKLQIELTHKQNKPYPYFGLTKHPDLTLITIQNFGAGPMIVKTIKIRYKNSNEYFENFKVFFMEKKIIINEDTYCYFDTAPTHILISGGSKDLLKINPKTKSNDFYIFQDACKDLLKDAVIIIDYEDIFENMFNFEQSFKFLGN